MLRCYDMTQLQCNLRTYFYNMMVQLQKLATTPIAGNFFLHGNDHDGRLVIVSRYPPAQGFKQHMLFNGEAAFKSLAVCLTPVHH